MGFSRQEYWSGVPSPSPSNYCFLFVSDIYPGVELLGPGVVLFLVWETSTLFSTEAEAIYIPIPGIREFPLLYSLSDIYCRMGVLVFHCYLFSLLSSSLLCDAEVRPLRTLFPRLPSWLTQILATEGKLEGGRNGEWVSSWFFWCLLASLQQYQLTLVAIWFWHHQKQPHSFPWEVLVQLLTVSSMVSMEPVFWAPRFMKPHLLLVIPALFNIMEPVIVQSLSHVWLSDPMDCTTPGFPVLHHLPDFSQTHVHGLDDAIQSFHPLSPPFPPAFNLSQHQGLFQWVGSLHQVAKVLELQHRSFGRVFSVDFL